MSEGQSRGLGGVARRLADRVKGAESPPDDSQPAHREPIPEPAVEAPGPAPAGAKKGLLAKVAANRKDAQTAQAELDALTRERDELRQQRLEIQQALGATIGKSVMPRLRVEKTNGTPSFVVSQRMMQRIYGATDDAKGLDGINPVFAEAAETARYARSHQVPVLDDPSTAEARIIVHGFKGRTPLVEVHGPHGVRHFEGADGDDPGDIRPAADYDATIPQPEGFYDLCAWSRTLSRWIPRPYAQLHWSVTPHGPQLHHIDVDPDRIPVLTPEWDKKLGLVFDGAYARYLKQPFRRGGLANRVPGGTFTPEENA